MPAFTDSVVVSAAGAPFSSGTGEHGYRVVDKKALAPGYYLVIRRHVVRYARPKDHYIGPFRFAVQARVFHGLYLEELIERDPTPCTVYLMNPAENPDGIDDPGAQPG